ncbi:MAG: hypothetical protein QNJ19_17725 [Woeseiaceae bacterium]|nr:hypothetical protein [Woeseiaceae bacterium]
METKTDTKARLNTSAAGNLRLVLTLSLVGLLSACARTDQLAYRPFVADIDGKSELRISTYPADFGRSRKHVPFIYRHMETYDKLYFQVFIRNKDQAGKNPHVESIHIHSFSYRFDGQPSTELITDYDDYFWMQNQPDYNKDYAESPPVLYVPNAEIIVSIAFTLNGIDYEFEGSMPSTTKKSWTPLLVHALR